MKDYCARRKADWGVVVWKRECWKIRALVVACMVSLTAVAQAIQIGSGPNTVRLVFEAPDFGIVIYDYSYTNALAPIDSYDLLTAVDALQPEISFGFLNFGDEEDPNYFLNSVTYNSVTLTNAPGPTFSPFWVQWASGGESGFPFAEPISSGSWTEGSGISTPYRLLEPGASDAFVFGEFGDMPVTVPIPEPASGLLIGVAMGTLCLRRRRQ